MSIFDDWRDIIARDLNWNNGSNRRSWSEATLDPLGLYDYATKRKPLLTDRSNEIKAAAQYVGQNVVPAVMEASKGETGWKDGLGDDLLRLTGGGVKNIGRGMQALDQAGQDRSNLFGRADQQAAFLVGNALRFTNFAGEKGGQAAGWLAKETGLVDEDAAKVLGMLGSDYLLTMGAGAAAKGVTRGAKLATTAVKTAAVNKAQALVGMGGVGITDTATAIKRSKLLTVSDELRAIPKGTKITTEMLENQRLIRQKADNLAAKAGPNPSKSQLDKINSMKSTSIEILPDDPIFYSNQSKALKLKYTQYEDSLNKLGTLQWHHQNMKAVSAPYLDRAWDIVKAGGGTEADILNLHYMALNHGVGMGDRLSALLPMGRVPHTKLHTWARKAGIQLDPKQIQELVQQLKGVDNMEDLTKLFNSSLENMAKPMTREAKIMNNVWLDLDNTARSRLAGLRNKRDEITRALNKAKKNNQPTKTLEKQLKEINNQYDPLKKDLVEQFFKNRPSYGDYTDEFANILPQSEWFNPWGQFGKAEQARERASESLHDLAKDMKGITSW